jgi:hypothetical protein
VRTAETLSIKVLNVNFVIGVKPFDTSGSVRHHWKALKLSITQVAKVGEAISWLLHQSVLYSTQGEGW